MAKKTKRLGRPPLKTPNDAAPLFIRLTPEEREKLEAAAVRAKSRTVVEWARLVLLRIADGMAP
jgi:hypothetical protein